jgi:hypothetical protein
MPGQYENLAQKKKKRALHIYQKIQSGENSSHYFNYITVIYGDWRPK